MIIALADARLAHIAEVATNNFGDTRQGGLAGPAGLVIILLLAIGTYLLIRNMNSRLRRLPERFPSPADEPTAGGGRASRTQAGGTPADADAGREPDRS
jgi:hypothetical protein